MPQSPYSWPKRVIAIWIIWLAIGFGGCVTTDRSESGAMEQAAAVGSPLIGEMAPTFRLLDHNDQPTSLDDFRGQWVVLYFYPQDDTPGCTCQATEFTELLRDFKDLNTTVLGVSPDPTHSHRLFRQKHGIRITLLNDPDHQVAQAYSAWTQMGWQDRRIGRIIRSTVLIDPHGRIAFHWPEVIPQGHAERVRRQLIDMQAHGT